MIYIHVSVRRLLDTTLTSSLYHCFSFVPHRRTQSVGHEPLRRQGSSTTSRPPQPLSAQAIKHIWVRTALFEKVLDKIVQYIVDNSR